MQTIKLNNGVEMPILGSESFKFHHKKRNDVCGMRLRSVTG